MLVRGTLMYWFLFLLFRFVIRRRVGSVGMADILVLVIISDAAQNAFSGTYESIGDGAILVCTLIGWTMLNDWLAFRFELAHKFFEPPPLLLVHRGRLISRNLRQEFITEDELRSQLREKGIGDFAEIERAYIESDGGITAIRRRRGAPAG